MVHAVHMFVDELDERRGASAQAAEEFVLQVLFFALHGGRRGVRVGARRDGIPLMLGGHAHNFTRITKDGDLLADRVRPEGLRSKGHGVLREHGTHVPLSRELASEALDALGELQDGGDVANVACHLVLRDVQLACRAAPGRVAGSRVELAVGWPVPAEDALEDVDELAHENVARKLHEDDPEGRSEKREAHEGVEWAGALVLVVIVGARQALFLHGVDAGIHVVGLQERAHVARAAPREFAESMACRVRGSFPAHVLAK
mmetsp:Transcript_1183/g.3417  ORF Transcript_1183/g.3417 Transcript_1183/m.3417 type:complete len:260 (+) Transcript_1183:1916-2695(+)